MWATAAPLPNAGTNHRPAQHLDLDVPRVVAIRSQEKARM
jgi:hypothetical protein